MSSFIGSLKAGDGVEAGKRIFDDNGFDVTPKPLSYTPQRSRRKTSVRSKYDETEGDEGSRRGLGKKTSKDGSLILKKVTVTRQNVEKDYLKELEIVKENLKTSKLDMEEATVKPATVVLYLEESAHFWHLQMASTNYVKTEDTLVQTDESGPTVRRYRLSSAAQTYNTVSKKKLCQTAPIEMSTSCVFASEWDLYDTYRRLSYEDEEAELDSDDLDLETHGVDLISKSGGSLQRPSVTSESTISQSNEQQPIIASRKANIQAMKVMRLPEFQYASAVAERLLAANTFHNHQTSFMGAGCKSTEITSGFHYIMNELWTFSYEESRNRIVNAIAWNTVNVNVVAVGYGYTKGCEEEAADGLVCCWSVKNPRQPERMFSLRSAVTALGFSQCHPHLLAVGCYNGAIIILDVSSKEGNKFVLNGEEGCLRYGPVGDLQWFFHTDFVVETEEIISVGKNGRVYKWNYLESYRSYEIMKLSYFQPNIKTTKTKPQKSKNRFKCNLKYLNGLSVSIHPKRQMIYYIGTQEGCVIKCSMNHHDRFEDIFPAHSGPVYGVRHSPFSTNIFCTYGADWYICIWADGLKEPLFKLYHTKQPVLGVAWSPIHSTIMASISGNNLSMWDLARKTIVPINNIKSSSAHVFTSVQFSSTGKASMSLVLHSVDVPLFFERILRYFKGRNILAGDIAGDVFVFNLVDMPYSPFLQEEAIIYALQRALVSKPQLRSYLDSFLPEKATPEATAV